MACTDNTKAIVSIAHGANGFVDPVGGGIRENITWGYNTPGNRVSPCLWIQQYRMSARAVFQMHETPVVRGTVADLVFVLERIDGGTTTVTAADVAAGPAEFDMDTVPHRQSQEFEYDAADSENLAPISVS